MTTDAPLKDLSLHTFDLPLLRGGPLYLLLIRAGIVRPGSPDNRLRIVFFIAITWAPLALLTIAQGTFLNPSIKVPFLYDFSEICRFLFVLPLLIVAENIVEPWLGAVIAQCRRLVPAADMEKFNGFIARALQSRDSVPIELFLLLLAFIRPHVGEMALPTEISSWRTVTIGGAAAPTAAFVYYLFVAKPLFAFLWFRWLWKYLIWGRLLVRISSLPLRVTPTHPDRMGGLGFIGVGQVLFSIIYFAFALQVASYVAEEIIFDGAHLMSFKYMILGVAVLGPILFLTPCLTFSRRLMDCKRRGLLEYGALADEYSNGFHEKWILGKRDENEALIGSADVQSLADMSNSFEVVREMRPIIVSKSAVLSFVAAALIPFTPLVFTVYPFDELLARLVKIVM